MRYLVFCEELIDECGKYCTCYGIKGINILNETTLIIRDITLDKVHIQTFVSDLNDSDVDPEFLGDIVEDFVFATNTLNYKNPFSLCPS